ncbi:MAG TPA: nitroreductase family deazaflavin-dependent oxidoreductase [Chloroflexota bacterium]|nr:nitroreductase family deazaflavin-dependent oxidoreductase [Chloroflexota bacterium]
MESTQPSFRRRRASAWLRLLLKAPVVLYRGPLADLLRSRCVMLLTTRGRTSGLPRTGAVSFMPVDDRYVVFSGWGVGSNWYRNLLSNPEVVITIGRQRLRGTARVIEDPSRRKELMQQMQRRSDGCGPPKPLRPVFKLSGIFDYDGELRMAVQAGTTLPVVEITPQ